MRQYETRIHPHSSGNEYQVHQPLTAGYRCNSKADALYLEHILNNLTDEQHIAACGAATEGKTND